MLVLEYEFNPQVEKPRMVAYVCHPRAGETRTDRPLRLIGQLGFRPVRDNENRQLLRDNSQRTTTKVVSGLQLHAQICTPVHIHHTHTRAHACAHSHTLTYMHTPTHTHVHTHTHTYSHTRTHKLKQFILGKQWGLIEA